jgi:hypothetical protein
MKPTVSATTTLVLPGSTMLRTVGSSVANNWSAMYASAPGERAEQRRLAGVRVADERERRNRDLGALLRPGLALLLDLLEPRGQRLHAFAEQPPVGFELCFAGTAIADATAALALEVGPAAHQARGDVL